jgi:signal recognition particle receptor subunit beta
MNNHKVRMTNSRVHWSKQARQTHHVCTLARLHVGIVYVIDSGDRERIYETKGELHAMLEHPELQSVAVLVMANKQDTPNVCTISKSSNNNNNNNPKSKGTRLIQRTILQ